VQINEIVKKNTISFVRKLTRSVTLSHSKPNCHEWRFILFDLSTQNHLERGIPSEGQFPRLCKPLLGCHGSPGNKIAVPVIALFCALSVISCWRVKGEMARTSQPFIQLAPQTIVRQLVKKLPHNLSLPKLEKVRS
jgi:hypothetical protein